MNHSPAPWPGPWRREYLDTIRRAIDPNRNDPNQTKCLEVLAGGFDPYWRGLRKREDRALFEVQIAQIRWYVENLMAKGVPSEEEKQKIKNGYRAIWDTAASALTKEFPTLDPNIVEKAKEGHLGDCYRKIDASLLPIFLRPFTASQLDQLKKRWEDLGNWRVDLWRQINGNNLVETQDFASLQTKSLTEHPHYLLTQRSLAQLLSQVWTVAATPPDYYRIALSNLNNAERWRFQARSQASNYEMRLERERSRQFLQTEQIGFLLSALIETAQHPPPMQADNQRGNVQPADGYDVNDVGHN